MAPNIFITDKWAERSDVIRDSVSVQRRTFFFFSSTRTAIFRDARAATTPRFAIFGIANHLNPLNQHRLDNDFIVFRGNGHESAGQALKGQVVLCLSAPLKLDELHLRLTGTLRLS